MKRVEEQSGVQPIIHGRSLRLAPRFRSAMVVSLLVGSFLFGGRPSAGGMRPQPQSTEGSVATKEQPLGDSGVSILSDTRGYDFKPYVKDVIRRIFRAWTPLLPPEARPPGSLRGESVIRFTLNRSGDLTAMHLEGSTHVGSLDRAAWGAITAAGKYPPLPEDFTGPNLELRIRFRVNLDRQDSPAKPTTEPKSGSPQ